MGDKKKRKLNWFRFLVIVLAFVEAGWLLFDGMHAFITGDYVTPNSGEWAGRLGPWAGFVDDWLGLDPRSTWMKAVFVVLGAGWLALLVRYLRYIRGAWWGMLLCAILSLWYLPWGTALSALQIYLLMRKDVRRDSV